MGRVFAAFALLLAAGLGGTGCDSEDEGCVESACADGERCVQDECRGTCTSDASCNGAEVCRGYQFADGEVGNYCVVLPGTQQPGGEGRFTACESDDECDVAHGFSCLDGECNYACTSHADCIEVGHCDARVVDGERQSFCVRDAEPPKPGELYTPCPNGDECADERLCLGAGAGDLDAHCTVDCSGDDDCALGYYCGTISRPPCEDACPGFGPFQGAPDNPRCVPLELIGEGQPYQCSELGIVRSVCRQREFCSPCESDADCLAVPNQVCARDESGEKICTRLCDTGSRSCPWGNAARCGNFDDELGAATCSHRSGSCHGSGETCEPCRTDADCPGGVCAAQQFTGERWCINFSTRCECPGPVGAAGTCDDGGCPDSPGGLKVMCIGDERSSLFNTCYAANSSSESELGASPQTGCWGPQ